MRQYIMIPLEEDLASVGLNCLAEGAPPADPKNKVQLRKLLLSLGLKDDDFEISGGGNSMSVELKDDDVHDKVSGKIAWGGYRSGYGSWVLSPNYRDKGDWNNSASAWHY